MRILLLKTYRDLRASLAQSIVLIIIVALGISSFVALVGAYRDLSTSYNHTYEQLKFADVTFEVQQAPQTVLSEIAAVPEVQAVTGRLIVDVGLRLPDDARYNAGEVIRSRLIGIPADHRPAVDDLLVEQGRYLSPSDSHVALLESHFAKEYGWGPGAVATPILNGEPVAFDVAGVASSPEYLIVSPSRQQVLASPRSFAVLFVPLSALQQLTGMEGAVNNLAVLISANADRSAVVERLQAKLQPYGLASTTLQEDQPSNAALRLDLEGYREIAYLMPGLILAVAAFSVYVMLGRMVRAQQPQVGLMKALGYENRSILAHYLSLGLVIGIVGAVVGVLGGLPLASGITQEYATELGIPLVQTRAYADLALAGVVLSLVVTALGGLGPSRASARIPPAEAMRRDPASMLVEGRPSVVERIVHPALWLRLPLRNVFRGRRRTITVGLGIVFAYVLVLMGLGMLDSMSYMLRHNFQDIERWNIQAVFSNVQQPEVLDQVRGWDGVQAVEPLIELPALISANGEERDTPLTALNPTQKMHVFDLPSGITPEQALRGHQVILTDALVKDLKVSKGDALTVKTAFGSFDATLGGATSELVGTAVYVSLETVRGIAGLPTSTFNALYLQVGAGQADSIKERLYSLPDAASVDLKSDLQQTWTSLMGLFYVFMGVIMAFAVAMAFALLFNAATVSVLERRREFATMRALGAGGSRTALYVVTESVILWLLTLVPGLLLGYWVAMQMGQAFSSDLFSFSIVIAPASYVVTAVGILVTMVLAGIPAIRRVNRLNLAEATKMLT